MPKTGLQQTIFVGWIMAAGVDLCLTFGIVVYASKKVYLLKL